MSFAIQMASDLCQVEPGSTVPVAIEVHNLSEGPVTFEVEIEGLDPTWTAVPVPTFMVEAGATHVERFFLKPPRQSESLSGTYPYVVTVRSLETGEVKNGQGALEVRPYSSLSVDIQPRRGLLSPFKKTSQFQIKVMNLGNMEETLQMLAADTDNMFAFEFDSGQLTLGPGQERAVALTAAGSRSPFLGSSRLQSFTASARSLQNHAVAAVGTGQIEQRAAVTPGTFIASLLVFCLLVGWFVLWPKAPTVDSLVVEPPSSVKVGEPVQIHWKTSRATSVSIRIGNWEQLKLMTDGQITYVPKEAGNFAIELTASSGERQTVDKSHILTVELPESTPKPEILQFTIDEKQLKLGQPFLLKYRFSDSVVRAMLYPMQKELDVKERSIQLIADTPGAKVVYTVKAYNKDGATTESSVTVAVTKPSKSRIVRFEVEPLELDQGGGTVNVSWSALDAAKVEIVYDDKTIDVTPAKPPGTSGGEMTGQTPVVIKEGATFKLVVTDDEGVSVTSTARAVKVKALPGEPGPDSGSTGGGH